MSRHLIIFTLLLTATSLAACSEEAARRSGGSGSGSGSIRDTGSSQDTGTVDDTSTADTDPDATPEDTGTVDTGTVDTSPVDTGQETGDTGTIDTGVSCTRTADCEVQFGAGFICVNGVCVEQLLPDPCIADGQECTDPAAQETDEFVCVSDTAGATAVCRQLCNAETADETSSEDCPLNTYCFDVGATSASGLTGACTPGDCTTNIFDATACDGVGTCFPVGHGASFCISAGTAIEGEPCGLDTSTTPPDSDICAPGLLCSNSLCVAPCDRTNGNADCTGGDACLAAFDFTPRNRPGLCGTACSAFSVGQCPADEACQPFLGRAGVNIWACVASTGNTTFGPEEICDETGSCQEGYLCIGAETDAGGNTINRCTQLCDTEAELAGDRPCASFSNPEICARSAVAGIGFCQESCQPFPRIPGSNYGCSTAGERCFPVVLTEDAASAPVGICDANDGTIGPFQPCAEDGTIGECADFAVCLDFSDDGAVNPNCNALCAPFEQGAVCGRGATCSAIFPLTGNLNFGICTQEFSAGAIGGRCTAEGTPCEAPGTLCLDTGAGATCVLACREGFDDCANDPGTTCNVGTLNPDVVPVFLGLCL